MQDWLLIYIYIYIYECVYYFYSNYSFKKKKKEIIMIIKTHNKLILNMYNLFSKFFIVYNLFSLKIKQFQKVISINLFSQIYNLLFLIFLLIFFFFWNGPYSSNYWYYVLYFLVSFGTIKIFLFQSYYSNSHFLKEIIMIIPKLIVETIFAQGQEVQL